MPMAAFAPALLRLFVGEVMDDAYMERLKRHYALFKLEAPDRPGTKTWKPSPRTTKRRKR